MIGFVHGNFLSPTTNASRSLWIMQETLTDEGDTLSKRMLYDACVGDISGVIAALEKGADVNTRDDDGATLMMVAARTGNTELGTAVLAYAPDLELTGYYCRTALLMALKEGNVALAEAMLQAGANPHVVCGRGDTALHMAIASRSPEAVACVLDRGVAIDLVDSGDDTPLTLAAACKMYDLVLNLADRGANINTRGNGGKTALLQYLVDRLRDVRTPAAARREDREGTEPELEPPTDITQDAFLQQLFDRGADANVGDNRDKTALMFAAEEGSESLCRLLLDRGADLYARDSQGLTAFDWAARAGNVPTMTMLLASGAKVDSVDDFGATALFRQMREPDPEIVLFLLQNGASPHSVNSNGESVLFSAMKTNSFTVVDYLLEFGADISTLNPRGQSLLDYAILNRMYETAHQLYLRGARPTRNVVDLLGHGDGKLDEINEDGNTLLIEAVFGVDPALITLLLDFGADVDRTDTTKATPLMHAARRSGNGLVALLLEHGANIHLRDRSGWTALRYAVEGQREDHVAILLGAGADPRDKDDIGKTPLKQALDYHMADMAALMLAVSPEPEIVAEAPEVDNREAGAREEDEEGEEVRADEETHKKKKKKKNKDKKRQVEEAAAEALQASMFEPIKRWEAVYSPHEMIMMEIRTNALLCYVTGPNASAHQWALQDVLEGEADVTITRRFGLAVLEEVYAIVSQLAPDAGLAADSSSSASPSSTSDTGGEEDSGEPVDAQAQIVGDVSNGDASRVDETGTGSTSDETALGENMIAPAGPMAGYRVVFTGTLQRFTRAQAELIVTENGGAVGSTVTELPSSHPSWSMAKRRAANSFALKSSAFPRSRRHSSSRWLKAWVFQADLRLREILNWRLR